MKLRAPWRWRWGLILLLPLRWGAWVLALRWSPFFGIALSLYIYGQLRAGYTEPRSPTGSQKGPEDEKAGGFVLEQDDPDRPNHWKVTHRD